jgi:hypothetical protein
MKSEAKKKNKEKNLRKKELFQLNRNLLYLFKELIWFLVKLRKMKRKILSLNIEDHIQHFQGQDYNMTEEQLIGEDPAIRSIG